MWKLNSNIIIKPNGFNKFLFCFGEHGSFVEDNGKYYKLIELLNEPKTTDNVLNILKHALGLSCIDEAAEVLNYLIESEFLVKQEDEKNTDNFQYKGELDWVKNGWGYAKIFHDSIVYSKFIAGDPVGVVEQIKSIIDITSSSPNIPSPTKKYEGHEIKLEDFNLELSDGCINFYDVIEARRTSRKLTPTLGIEKSLLSKMFFHSAKFKSKKTSNYLGDYYKRTSPSGGSLHPVEIYMINQNAEIGLKEGVFHYNPISHSLFEVSNNLDFEDLKQLCQNQIEFNSNAIILIITARFERNFYKYRYSKSYLFTLFDVGHLVQTLILVCTALGLKTFLTPALDVALANSIINIDNIYDECPVYFIAISK